MWCVSEILIALVLNDQLPVYIIPDFYSYSQKSKFKKLMEVEVEIPIHEDDSEPCQSYQDDIQMDNGACKFKEIDNGQVIIQQLRELTVVH